MARTKKSEHSNESLQSTEKQERKVKRVNCEFDPDIYDQIKITAWLTDNSMNGLINDAVKEYLSKHSNEDLEAIKKLAQKIMK